MSLRVIVGPDAFEDIAQAATWYEEQQSGLGEDLTKEIVRAMEHAAEAPQLHPVVRSRDGMRRVLAKRFPYKIFFTLREDTLYVHAVLHAAQHDRRWRQRN